MNLRFNLLTIVTLLSLSSDVAAKKEYIALSNKTVHWGYFSKNEAPGKNPSHKILNGLFHYAYSQHSFLYLSNSDLH